MEKDQRNSTSTLNAEHARALNDFPCDSIFSVRFSENVTIILIPTRYELTMYYGNLYYNTFEYDYFKRDAINEVTYLMKKENLLLKDAIALLYQSNSISDIFNISYIENHQENSIQIHIPMLTDCNGFVCNKYYTEGDHRNLENTKIPYVSVLKFQSVTESNSFMKQKESYNNSIYKNNYWNEKIIYTNSYDNYQFTNNFHIFQLKG